MKTLMLEDILFMKLCKKEHAFMAKTGQPLLLVNFHKEESAVGEDNKDVMVLMMDMHNKLDVMFNKVDMVAGKLGVVVDMGVVREFNMASIVIRWIQVGYGILNVILMLLQILQEFSNANQFFSVIFDG